LPAPLQDSTSFRLAVSQPVYTGGRIEAGIAAASAATASARADAAARRRTVAASAEQAWWNLVLASESEEAVAENLAAVSAHRADAERRLSQGTGTKSELLSWQMQEIQAGVRRRAAATDLEAARARLNILLGLPWDSPTEAAAPPEAEMGSGPVAPDSLLDTALSLRPELAAAAARISAQEASVALAQAGLLPSLYLTGSMTYADPNPKAFPQRSGFEFLWDVGLVASIDVGRVPASLGQIADAKAQVSQARDLLRQTRDAVTQEVIQARFELEKARDRFETSTAAVSLAQENLRVQNDRFSAGLALASEVADAEASLLSAKLERFRSRVEWELAHAALRDAAGGDAASDGK
ncbi:MAG TPA: TolC family protein, partial [Rectinemataceae bacterium]|nr:TolC family protein [Rectinemataceae bacterium]